MSVSTGKSGKRNNIKRKNKRINKRLKIFIVVSECLLIVIVGGIFFWLGRSTGGNQEHTQAQAQVQVSVQEEELQYPENNSEDRNQKIESVVRNPEMEEKEEILLVNKEHALPEDYEVELKTLPDGTNRAAKEAYGPLCDMLEAGRKEGLAFEICSSYRDVERQRELFDEDVDALVRIGYSYSEAYEEVAKETMPPGHSEHSTGLAFDIVALDYQMLDDGQERTEENRWLQEHCAEYGFILRYPEGKEDITNISYESWHYRYVGEEVAKYIMDEGITLEEYLEISAE